MDLCFIFESFFFFFLASAWGRCLLQDAPRQAYKLLTSKRRVHSRVVCGPYPIKMLTAWLLIPFRSEARGFQHLENVVRDGRLTKEL